MAATSAALANRDNVVVQRSVNQVSRIVVDFDTSLTESLSIATRGLGESLNQMTKAPGKAEQAVSASNQAIEALFSLTVITFSEGKFAALAFVGFVHLTD